jgi:hypothetical protein
MLSGAVPNDWEHEIVPKCNSAGKQKLRVSLEKASLPSFKILTICLAILKRRLK